MTAPTNTPDTITEWRVQFRTCDLRWAADREHWRTFAHVWDQIPWSDRLTVRVTTDEASARSQHAQLLRWQLAKAQPIKDVALHSRQITKIRAWPDGVTVREIPDTGWEPA